MKLKRQNRSLIVTSISKRLSVWKDLISWPKISFCFATHFAPFESFVWLLSFCYLYSSKIHIATHTLLCAIIWLFSYSCNALHFWPAKTCYHRSLHFVGSDRLKIHVWLGNVTFCYVTIYHGTGRISFCYDRLKWIFSFLQKERIIRLVLAASITLASKFG